MGDKDHAALYIFCDVCQLLQDRAKSIYPVDVYLFAEKGMPGVDDDKVWICFLQHTVEVADAFVEV